MITRKVEENRREPRYILEIERCEGNYLVFVWYVDECQKEFSLVEVKGVSIQEGASYCALRLEEGSCEERGLRA